MRRRPPRSPLFPYTTLFRSLELCRRIRADTRAGYTYIILTTGLSDRQDVERGMKAGADDYLIKPVDLFHLQMRLDRKSTRLNSSHANISYAVFCLKKKKIT